MTTNATNQTTITADLPDFASDTIDLRLLSSIAISGTEIFPGKIYTMVLDVDGVGSLIIPTPDGMGNLAWLWEVNLPDGREQNVSIAWSSLSQDLAIILATAVSTTTPSDIAQLIANKVNRDGDTMTGDLTLSGAPTSDLHAATKKYVDDSAGGNQFDTIELNEAYSPTGSEPVASMFWEDDGLSFVVDDYGNISIGKEIWDRMTNLSGAHVVNGDVVSGIGASGNRKAFVLTDATDAAKARACIGMVTVPTINNNQPGRITKSGEVKGLNTTGYPEGTEIFVDPLNNGKWTATEPAAGNYIISIGVVLVEHVNQGVVNVNIRIVPKMAELSDVNGTALTTDGQFMVWDNVAGYFDATANTSDFDPAGTGASEAAAAQAYAIQRANHTGTQTISTISDAGTMATEDAGDYYPKSDFSASPTTDEPIKADGSGAVDFGGVVSAASYKIGSTDALQIPSVGETLVGNAGGGVGYVGSNVTASGHEAARENTGYNVTASGYYAARGNTGNNVIAIGYWAARENTGDSVIAIGLYTARDNTGGNVTAIGQAAAYENTGNNVTASGYYAARGNTFSDCVAIGKSAQPTKSNQFITGGLNSIGGISYINAMTIVSGTSGGAFEGLGKSSTTDGKTMGRMEWSWNVSTHASREADLALYASDYGGEREGLRIRGNGTEPETSVNGVTPIARQLLATGAGATVDDIITVLQNFGIAKQS